MLQPGHPTSLCKKSLGGANNGALRDLYSDRSLQLLIEGPPDLGKSTSGDEIIKPVATRKNFWWPGLVGEVFAMLTPVTGSGNTARYLEANVDRQLRAYFGDKDRAYDGAEAVLREILEVILSAVGSASSPNQFLVPAEAAQMMRVHVQTVMKWCRERKLEAIKRGRSWLIPHEAVEAYVRSCRLIGGDAK